MFSWWEWGISSCVSINECVQPCISNKNKLMKKQQQQQTDFHDNFILT